MKATISISPSQLLAAGVGSATLIYFRVTYDIINTVSRIVGPSQIDRGAVEKVHVKMLQRLCRTHRFIRNIFLANVGRKAKERPHAFVVLVGARLNPELVLY